MKLVRAAWSSSATAVAVVASAVALAFSLWPALRPDPREVLAAKLHVETVEPGVSLGAYQQRVGQRVKGASRADLRTRGYVVYMQIQIEGRKHRDLVLDQVLYRASTRRRIVDQGPTRDSYFQSDTPNDRWIAQVFVLEPPYDFPVFVRMELFDSNNSLMAFADTPPIAPAR
jgi:hypothetical protein